MNNIKLNDNYLYIDVENCFPKEKQTSNVFSQVIRITKVTLPFLSLYQPFGKGLALGLGMTKTLTSLQGCYCAETKEKFVLSTFYGMLAVASVAGTVFCHPLGIFITTVQDIGGNCVQVFGAVRQGEVIEVAKQMTHLANHSFYLMMMLYGSLELQIASLAMQVIIEGISSMEELNKRNWLEVTGHMCMAAVRVHQLQDRVLALQEKWQIEEAIRSFFVGELHEKWQFPSDHLPVGIEVNGTKVISWNVLNNQYMNWVTEKDSQGLKGSMISDLDVLVREDGFTKRDQKIIEMILSMIDGNTGMIALQECAIPFIETLNHQLPIHWKMVKTSETPIINQEIILYNSAKFSFNSSLSQTVQNAFPYIPETTFQNAFFESLDRYGKSIRLFNVHIPGDPNLPGREDFAKTMKQLTNAEDITIALGDNNFVREEMIDAYKKAGFFNFKLHSPWQTNIDPYTKRSKAIDHIFVKGETSSRNLSANEIFSSQYLLEDTIQLLKTETEAAAS